MSDTFLLRHERSRAGGNERSQADLSPLPEMALTSTSEEVSSQQLWFALI